MDELEKKPAAWKGDDPTAATRKRDHIQLAFDARIEQSLVDERFFYEPLLAPHPKNGGLPDFTFLEKTFCAPIWVSSMTGGTEWAYIINHNLARACREFGMGMGLGSCRSLLFSDESLKDFDVRKLIGDELPLFANLGVAQVEQLLASGELWRVKALLDKLQADGLIIHVNPLQEWLQPEGDRFEKAPLQTITSFLEKMETPVIVKEVGQGMGYESLKALFQLPLAAIDFAASGGTNFARLELLRSDKVKQEIFSQLAHIGHTAVEMVHFTNKIVAELGDKIRCRQVIISGGVQNFLDGYYLTNKLNLPSVYGQASGFLKHARGSYEELAEYIESQVQGLALASSFLKVR